MKPQKWNRSLFVSVSRLPASPAKARAYQAARELLGRKNRKLLHEWEVFSSFSQTAGLSIEPADVDMLDPNSPYPPPPDIECHFAYGSLFFELGEILQEDIAKASSPKTRRSIVAPSVPLIRIWDTLQEMLNKKLRKCYDPEARPISLLLYYASGPSFWEFLRPIIIEKTQDIQAIFEACAFENIWLFDVNQREVLFCFSKSSMPFIN